MIFGVIASIIFNEAPAITWKHSQRIIYVMILAGVHLQLSNSDSSAGKRGKLDQKDVWAKAWSLACIKWYSAKQSSFSSKSLL